MNKITFEELKPILKDKWLDYYEANSKIIDKLIEYGYCSGNNKFPRADFIVGTMMVLEPRLEEYLSCFLLVSKNLDQIIEAIGLNFHPSDELNKRKQQHCKH